VNYWLDLFTGRTWKEFRDRGANISGFNKRSRNTVQSIKPGDILVCYLTGLKLWVGATEVIGQSNDTKKIWSLDDFPERLEVRPIVMLDPEYGVPLDSLKGKVDFFKDDSYRGTYKGFLRGSPNQFRNDKDGELIVSLLKDAERNPVNRPFNLKEFDRIPLYKVAQKGKNPTGPKIVSVPDDEESPAAEVSQKTFPEPTYTTDHVMMQYHLLTLGSDMGLDVWVARNDRSKIYKGKTLGSLPRMVQELPAQFNDATQRTIELIDILWLKGNSIIAAFEVESTTSIYSGLLRMSDLLALQPNLNIKLYLVAADERRNKVKQEILRPTFELTQKPLSKVCGFVSIANLNQKIEGIQKLGLASALNPEFLDAVAEYFTADDN
jgi:hypothetical protein